MDAEALGEYLQALDLDPGRAAIARRVSEVCCPHGRCAAVPRVRGPRPGARARRRAVALAHGRRPVQPRAPGRGPGRAAGGRGRGSRPGGRTGRRSPAWPSRSAGSRTRRGPGATRWSWTTATRRPGSSWRPRRRGSGISRLPTRCWRRPGRSTRSGPGSCSSRAGSRRGWAGPTEAARLYREHLRVHPEDQPTRRRLVNLLGRQGRHAEAYREADRRADGRAGRSRGRRRRGRPGPLRRTGRARGRAARPVPGGRPGRPDARDAGGGHPVGARARARGAGPHRGLGRRASGGLPRAPAGGAEPLRRRRHDRGGGGGAAVRGDGARFAGAALRAGRAAPGLRGASPRPSRSGPT